MIYKQRYERQSIKIPNNVWGLKGANKLFLNIKGQLIPSNEHVKLLGDNIDNSLKFQTHVKELCKKVNQKKYAFGRLRPYLGEQKSKLLLNLW